MVKSTLAVFTGDIVKSARLSAADLDVVLDRLAEAADDAHRWAGARDGARFTRFRGDGWQCLAPKAEFSLRAALFLRARMRSLGRGFDTRISVGIGTGTLPETDGLAAAGGPAFEISGNGLDGMGRAARLTVAWGAPEPCARSVAAVFALADEISRHWTERQAEVFVRALAPDAPPQRKIAEDLGVVQQTVAEHLSAGGERALRQALSAVEARD